MGMPSLDIVFRNVAQTVQRRSQRGVVAAILLDDAALGTAERTITSVAEIPAAISEQNKKYLTSIFTGNVSKPSKIIAYVLASDRETLTDALAFFETQKMNYVVGPPDLTSTQAEEIKAWVIAQRANKRYVKAVLPNTAADNEGIINFATAQIKVGEADYTTAEYCGRIAGLIAGTPPTMSCTYVTLPEATDVSRLTNEQMDAAVDAGKFILFHDGEKVKTGRAVNSLTTTTAEKSEQWKKIKIVDTIDLIKEDLRLLVQDNYVGKYSNTYDNKCLLITAIGQYFAQLEVEGLLLAGESVIEIDIAAQEEYLRGKGQDVSQLTEQQIKTADTGSFVFLRGVVRIPDSMEDFVLALEF